MTTLYRLAKLICLGIIAYSLWRISQKDFVANVTSDEPKWLDRFEKGTQETASWLDEKKRSRRLEKPQ